MDGSASGQQTGPQPDSASGTLARAAAATAALLSIARSLGLAALVVVAAWAAWTNRGPLLGWLADAQKLSGFGVSLERGQLTALPIADPAGRSRGYFLDAKQLDSVQARAIWLRPVLSGAVVLWVDDNPAGNNNLIQFFQWAGILLRFARTNDEAMLEIRAQPFDLVISDVSRDTSGEPRANGPLESCPFHFLSLPPGGPDQEDLDRLNMREKLNPEPGWQLADLIHRGFGADRPPLIYFTGYGESAVSACAELTTDNPFRLIHAVFGALERQRATEFNRFRPPWAPQPSAAR